MFVRCLSPPLHFVFGLLCCQSITYANAASNLEPSVTLSAGVVVGTSTSSTVNAFLGIPYANSPERFAPPKPVTPWSSPHHAQVLRPACIQQFSGPEKHAARTKAYFNNPYNEPPQESEDCLYLNIYAPSNASPKNKKAVLFWLFGGNLQFGTGSLAYYDGTNLAANEDVVVVTINYRTNIFGFSNSPEIAFGQQNSGFLDQRQALQWVQDNIVAFGGDPTMVMIFGESAGAYSALQLVATSPSPPQFSGVILQSPGLRMMGNSSVNYAKVASHFNCSAAVSTLKCLRDIPAVSIKQYIEANKIDFAPVDGDGTHIKDLRSAIESRQLARVPIIIGSNANEGTVFLAILGVLEGSRVSDALLNLLGPRLRSYIPESVHQYLSRALDAMTSLSDSVVTNSFYTCPMTTFANHLAANGYTTWQYYFSAAFPSVELFPNCGAYHSAEIPLVFGTYAQSHGHETAPVLQSKLSKHMQHIWASFAKQQELEPSTTATAQGFELVRVSSDGGSGFNTTSRRSGDLVCRLSEGIFRRLLSLG